MLRIHVCTCQHRTMQISMYQEDGKDPQNANHGLGAYVRSMGFKAEVCVLLLTMTFFPTLSDAGIEDDFADS
jgi:hypothetical protein